MYLTSKQREILANMEQFDRDLAIRKKTLRWKFSRLWYKLKLWILQS
jgi:hypothetical protein